MDKEFYSIDNVYQMVINFHKDRLSNLRYEFYNKFFDVNGELKEEKYKNLNLFEGFSFEKFGFVQTFIQVTHNKEWDLDRKISNYIEAIYDFEDVKNDNISKLNNVINQKDYLHLIWMKNSIMPI